MDQIIIPKQIFEEMLVHCKAIYPNEACGILAGMNGEVSKIYQMTNTENSPVTYMMDSKEQFKVMKDMRENNLSMVAIFHSHPSSSAYPSAKDVSLAFYEDCFYIIISLLNKEPQVKAFLIRDGKITEVSFVVR